MDEVEAVVCVDQSGVSSEFPSGNQYNNGNLKGIKTRFIVDENGNCIDLEPTLNRINAGQKFPIRNDGTIFNNREGLLPSKPTGYYKEYVVPNPSINGPGPMRLIIGGNAGQWDDFFFTIDHYKSFIKLW